MSTQPVCEKCGGTGWIIVERSSVSGAERCACLSEGRAERLEGRANIPPLYQKASFDNFRIPGSENPIARSALIVPLMGAKTYAHDYPKVERPGLLLVGYPGCGKTHLAVAALRALLAKGHDGLFWNYQHLLERIRAGYDATANFSDKTAYREALEIEVLLIDDLGAQKVTEWVEDTVCSIITHRCNNHKPLIATTNLPDVAAGSNIIMKSQENLQRTPRVRRTLGEQIGERARSRLFEMCTVVKMPEVADFRIPRPWKS
jgi:DNA replication protein DnaC